jgi:AICAR transformylase/IMP cyclohydrolase PurH
MKGLGDAINITNLRYGHNPHQDAKWEKRDNKSAFKINLLNDKSFSLTDLQNIDLFMRLLCDIQENLIVIIKHGLLVGAAYGSNNIESLLSCALSADPEASHTGTIATNMNLNIYWIDKLLQYPFDIIVSTDISFDVIDWINNNREINSRIVHLHKDNRVNILSNIYSLIDGSTIVEDIFQTKITSINDFKIFYANQKNKTIDSNDFVFAWYMAIQCRSNCAILVKNRHVIAASLGNQDGISAIELCLYRAINRHKGNISLSDSILAIDGNLPYSMPFDLLKKNGIGSLIMPGNATNDEQIIECCHEVGVNVAFTGERGFSHR